MSKAVCRRWEPKIVEVLTADGNTLKCCGVGKVELAVGRLHPMTTEVLVVDGQLLGFDLLLGIDTITELGGVHITRSGKVHFPAEDAPQCAAITISEPDFSATFDHRRKAWTASWKWADGQAPKQLKNRVPEYPVAESIRDEYESELQLWLTNGWLVPYPEEELGPPKALIPLMAVVQATKNKVRPVLDYRELNGFVDAYTGNADVCAQKLREWRQQGSDVAVLDLRKAYLQIHVHKSLWPFQTVVLKGRRYCLTRLGFGLNVAPMIMRAIVNAVMSQDKLIKDATSSYIDDIYVNESVASSQRVREHLESFGLVSKDPERLEDGARVLGLQVLSEGGRLRWKRGSEIPEVPPVLTRRNVFSVCGKLVGHFPVCGWLRVAAASIKRRANAVTSGWDDDTCDAHLRSMLSDTIARVRQSDPVRGDWCVSGREFTVWVDASSLAIGVALEANGAVVEDACWLRPTNDPQHINLAELDATLKGINLALQWQATVLHLITDSACTHRWISDALTGKARLTTKAASEMLIRRRLGTLTELVDEYGLSVDVALVRSDHNRADKLTRVPQRWLTETKQGAEPVTQGYVAAATSRDMQQIRWIHHQSGHPGIRRTLYFAKQVNPAVSKADVRIVVRGCEACQSIDPAPVQWQKGALNVDASWDRLAVDITHYGREHYLTLIDCGPSRFAIWRLLRRQDTASVVRQLESIFLERGPPAEILTDNGTVFTCQTFQHFLRDWGVHLHFRCAYVPEGNGIVERNHRSVKAITARKQCAIPEAVYWHNVTPKDSTSPSTAPANVVHTYRVRIQGISVASPREPKNTQMKYRVGDAVWVRTPHSRCTDRSKTGHVTGLGGPQSVLVDGTPRHIKDLRPFLGSPPTSDEDDSDSSTGSARLIRIGPAPPAKPSNASSPETTGGAPGDTAQDSLSKDKVPTAPLRRSTRRKRPAPDCYVFDQ